MTKNPRVVIGGVDTHKDTLAACVLDAGTGTVIGVGEFTANPAGYRQVLTWMLGLGAVEKVGVEGTSSYGAGLSRHLSSAGVEVVEVDRPDRKTRRHQGKSDPIDAEAAARAVLAGRATGAPKDNDGDIESIRILRIARTSAIKARTQAANQIHALVVTAPEPLRAHLRDLSLTRLVNTAATWRPGPTPTDTMTTTKIAVQTLARRHLALTREIKELDQMLAGLVQATNPALLQAKGVGTDVAGQLLATAGDNPGRLRSESSFAHLCGVAPLPASSGRTTGRHRLNRGGDRQANRALYIIALSRMRHDPRTRGYVQRRTTQGLNKKEIIRCLKRAIAREIYHLLTAPTAVAAPTTNSPQPAA